jgi:hypothetical protein
MMAKKIKRERRHGWYRETHTRTSRSNIKYSRTITTTTTSIRVAKKEEEPSEKARDRGICFCLTQKQVRLSSIELSCIARNIIFMSLSNRM